MFQVEQKLVMQCQMQMISEQVLLVILLYQNSGNTSITFTPIEDYTTEGTETLILQLTNSSIGETNGRM